MNANYRLEIDPGPGIGRSPQASSASRCVRDTTPRRRVYSRSYAALVGCILMLTTGCAGLRPGSAPLAGSLNELMPHGDRDHFVYIWQRVADGKRLAEGVQVEHVQRSPESDEFDVILSEDGIPAGRLRMRDDGQVLALLNEDDLQQQIRLSFTPALTRFEIPIVAGEHQKRATAVVTSLAKEGPATSVDVSQIVRLYPARRITSTLGNYPHGVSVETERVLHWPWGDSAFTSIAMVVPGLGEIRSEASGGEGFVLRRELACAIISGHAVGDCGAVEAMVQELRDARSSNLR